MSAMSSSVGDRSRGRAEPPAPSRRSRIVRRTVVGLSLTAAVAFALWMSSLSFGARWTLAVALGVTVWSIVEAERIRLFAHTGAALATLAAALATALLSFAWLDPASPRHAPADWTPLETYWRGLALVAGGGLLIGWLGVLPGIARRARAPGRERAATAWLLVPWLALPLFALHPLRVVLGVEGLVAFLLLAKVGDVAGYYVGNAIGETRPFPRISPGKTTAGCVASMVAGVAAGIAIAAAGLLPAGHLGYASGALAGLFVNVAAQAGDLFESAMKRRVGVKDAATTFGPSGGMLDLVDSLLFAGPVALVTWPLLFHWPAFVP